MDIEIKNCNNIDEARISIKENYLNIKFAANGTGKSTIAKAILLKATDPELLKSLTPFKFLANKDSSDDTKPFVSDNSGISSVAVF